VNGVDVTFTNCDGHPNSYFALFTDYGELSPSTNAFKNNFPVCRSLFTALKPTPSTRAMPIYFFLFMETHWGGCGCYTQTDGRASINGIVNAAIGFRWGTQWYYNTDMPNDMTTRTLTLTNSIITIFVLVTYAYCELATCRMNCTCAHDEYDNLLLTRPRCLIFCAKLFSTFIFTYSYDYYTYNHFNQRASGPKRVGNPGV